MVCAVLIMGWHVGRWTWAKILNEWKYLNLYFECAVCIWNHSCRAVTDYKADRDVCSHLSFEWGFWGWLMPFGWCSTQKWAVLRLKAVCLTPTECECYFSPLHLIPCSDPGRPSWQPLQTETVPLPLGWKRMWGLWTHCCRKWLCIRGQCGWTV